MKQIDKEYYQPFLLEPTKLTRLVDKIHERLGDHAGTTKHDSFEVFLSGNRHETLGNADSVLALENSRKHKIERLLITCSAATRGAIRPEHEVLVDFGKEKKAQTTTTKMVEISVRSDVAGWANRTLSEIEEQVERTWMRHRIPVAALAALVVALLSSILFQFVQLSSNHFTTQEILRPMWLRSSDLDRIEQIVAQNRTITEEEMREIKTRQLRNILEDYRPQQPAPKGRGRQAVLVLIPLVILVGCAFALLQCYPNIVFLWGDEVDRYAAILQRRKTIWNIIVGIMLVGVLANLLSARLLSSLPQ
jgi:hypothetical protein